MAKKKPKPAETMPVPYIAATVTMGEAATSRASMALRPEEAARVARAMQLSVANACSILSRICASQRIRLYAPAGTAEKARRVRGAKAAWLKGDGPYRHGRKAMEYAGATEECEEVLDHPILDVLHDPDPFQTQTDWLRLAYWYLQSTGKTYIYTGERMGGQPTSLYLLGSQYTRPELSKTGFIVSYKYGRDETSAVRYPAEEVIYLREMTDPTNPTNAVSWVQNIVLYADNEHAAVASEVARWANGGLPGAIFRHPTGTNPTTMKQTEAAIDASNRGVNKAGKNLYIRDLEVIQHGTKPHEMNYLPGIEQAERAVYRAAGIPEAVWKLNDANLASASAADPQFMAYTVGPITYKFAEGLTEWLCPLFGIEPGRMWFAADNPVAEDVEASALRVDRGFTSGYVYVNEARAVLGLDPVDEKLNTLGKPAPVPTITLPNAPMNAPKEPEAEEIEEDETDEDTEQDDSGVGMDDERPTDPPADGSGDGNKSKPAGSDRAGCGCGGGDCVTVKRWADGPLVRTKAEDGSAIPVTPLEGKLQEALKPILESAYERMIGGGTVGALNTAELNQVLTAAMREIFKEGAKEFATQVDATIDPAEPIVAVDARDYAEEYAAELVTEIDNTTRERIQGAVTTGIAEGKPLAQIQDELRAQVPTMSDERAEMIARTETGRAMSHGVVNQAKELGYDRKGWILSGNPCGLCEALAAGVPAEGVPIEEPYYPAGTTIVGTDGKAYTLKRSVTVPSDAHPNCSCGADPMITGDEP